MAILTNYQRVYQWDIYIYIYEIWLYMSPEGKYGSNPIFFHIYIATVDGISIL